MATNKVWVDPPISEPPKEVPSDIIQVPGIRRAEQPWGLIPSIARTLNRKSEYPLMAPGENSRKDRGRG